MRRRSAEPRETPDCPHCAKEGVVKLRQVRRGATKTIEWHCLRCDRYWALKKPTDET